MTGTKYNKSNDIRYNVNPLVRASVIGNIPIGYSHAYSHA